MEARTKFCPHCGTPVYKDAIACTECGRSLRNDYEYGGLKGGPRNKWIALFLCLFTGFGHKFYEGDIVMGIVYIFTAGLFGIGWLFDIITLSCIEGDTYYVG